MSNQGFYMWFTAIITQAFTHITLCTLLSNSPVNPLQCMVQIRKGLQTDPHKSIGCSEEWGLTKQSRPASNGMTSGDTGGISMVKLRDHFVYAPSQWEMLLQCNFISHWPGPCTKWKLYSLLKIGTQRSMNTNPSGTPAYYNSV